MLEKHLQPRWHAAAADLLFSPAPFEIHPHHMKARCCAMSYVLQGKFPICRTGRQGRDCGNLCGRAAEEDDASLDQTGTKSLEYVRVTCLIISHWTDCENSLLWTVRIDSPAQVFLLIFTAFISTPKFEDIYSSSWVQARDMQEVFRQAKLRTTRKFVDAWKALSSARAACLGQVQTCSVAH